MEATQTPAPCVWRKNRDGEWMVMGPASIVVPGAQVTVQRSDLSVSTETIASVRRPFDINGVPHVYGRPVAMAKSYADEECIECGEPLYTEAQRRSGYCNPNCG